MRALSFDPFESYFTHHILKQHFTKPSQNYFRLKHEDGYREKRYNENWLPMKNAGVRNFFTNYTSKFREKSDMRNMLLSIMVTRSPNTTWDRLYDLDIYQKWTGRIHMMHVIFENDLLTIRRKAGSLRQSIKAAPGDQPMFYTLLMAGVISMETFAWIVEFQPKVIDVMNPYFDPLDLAWQEKRMIAMKYPMFLTRLNINQERLKTILKGYVAQ